MIETFKSGAFHIHCDLPDQCPHCGGKITPHVVEKYSQSPESGVVVFLLRCPDKTCHEFFISVYDAQKREEGNALYYQGIIRTYSYSPIVPVGVSGDVANISAEFATTYTHALNAKNKGLDSIVGVSLRKSLEFLVKDFAIYRNPEDADKIKRSTLNNVIQAYYKDLPTLKVVADTARKIGNDETHYYRKYTDVDVEDLLGLVRNFSSHIDLILGAKELENRMGGN